MRVGTTRVLAAIFGTVLMAMPFMPATATCLGDCDSARYQCGLTANSAFQRCLNDGTYFLACEADLEFALQGCDDQHDICVLSCGGSSGGGPSNGAPPGNHNCFAGCRSDYLTCLFSGTPQTECEAIQTQCFQYCGG